MQMKNNILKIKRVWYWFHKKLQFPSIRLQKKLHFSEMIMKYLKYLQSQANIWLNFILIPALTCAHRDFAR